MYRMIRLVVVVVVVSRLDFASLPCESGHENRALNSVLVKPENCVWTVCSVGKSNKGEIGDVAMRFM